MKLHVKKGDTVLVLSGKDKDKRGKILSASPCEGRVIVEGVNIIKRHIRPTRKLRQGGIIERPAPIYTCKVMLVCPKCSKPTRISKMWVEGKKVRRCKKCGELIDK